MATVFKRNLLIEKVREISLKLTSVQVTGETRRLRYSWTPELAQDLDHYIDSTEHEDLYKRVLLIETYKKPLSRRSRRRSGRRFQDSFINKI